MEKSERTFWPTQNNWQTAGGSMWTSLRVENSRGAQSSEGSHTYCNFYLQVLHQVLTVSIKKNLLMLPAEREKKKPFWNVPESVLLNKTFPQEKLFCQSLKHAGVLLEPNLLGGSEISNSSQQQPSTWEKGNTEHQLPPAFHVGNRKYTIPGPSSHPVSLKGRKENLRSMSEVHLEVPLPR